jgi:hypothetical protein
MTVRRPKFPRSHAHYQADFEEAALPAIRSLIAVAVSAGWAPDTVAEGLLVLAHAHVQAIVVHYEREKEMRSKSVDAACLLDPP